MSLLLSVVGLLSMVFWYIETLSIYGLVFGIFFLILAWFVFHFRDMK